MDSSSSANADTTTPPQRPTLFVHVGHSKAGSSTIQESLRINANALRARGLLIADKDLGFPESGPLEGYPLVPFRRLCDEHSPDNARAEFRAAMEALRRKLIAGDRKGAVISSENLSAVEGARLFAGLDEIFAVRVIYFVRRQDEWIESAWKQWGLKCGMSLDDFARERIQLVAPGYLERARAWRLVDPAIRVVPLNVATDVAEDFWNFLELADFTPETTTPRNQTFDWSVLDMLASNPHLFADVNDNRVLDLLESLLPENAPRDGHGLLSPQLSREIMDRNAADNDLLRSEFFPNHDPLHRDPGSSPTDEARNGRGAVAGIYRYLGLELLMLETLKKGAGPVKIGSPRAWLGRSLAGPGPNPCRECGQAAGGTGRAKRRQQISPQAEPISGAKDQGDRAQNSEVVELEDSQVLRKDAPVTAWPVASLGVHRLTRLLQNCFPH